MRNYLSRSVLAIALCFGNCCSFTNSALGQEQKGANPAELRYVKTTRLLLSKIEANLAEISRSAEEAAATYANNPSSEICVEGPAFFRSELCGRSGGLIKLQSGSRPTPSSIVIAAVLENDPDIEGTLKKLQESAKSADHVIVIHSPALSSRLKRSRLDAHLVPLPVPDGPALSKNRLYEVPIALSVGWTWMMEFVGALTRRGKMPPIYQSYMIPGAMDWAKPFQNQSGPKFHSESPATMKEGALGLAWLDALKDSLSHLESEGEPLLHAAQTIRTAKANGRRIFVASSTHTLPYQIELARQNGSSKVFEPLPNSWQSGSDALPITAGDVLLGMGYDSILTGAPFGYLDIRAREKGAQIIWSAATLDPSAPELSISGEINIRQHWSNGDAEVEIPGYHHKAGPISGVVSTVIFWTLVDQSNKPSASGNVVENSAPTGQAATDQPTIWNPNHFTSVEEHSSYTLVPALGGTQFSEPIEIAYIKDLDRYFIGEIRRGIVSIPATLRSSGKPGSLFYDLAESKRVERGMQLYSFAFGPESNRPRYLYVFVTHGDSEKENGSRILRYTVAAAESVDYASETLVFQWNSGGHAGGAIRFGKDGMLYISIGDGQFAEPPDVKKTGQFIGDVFSSVLRISVEGQTNGMHYSIPADNPFVNTPSARGEVWAYGLRNPWRMSFDDATGNLWLGDVGWDRREMIHKIVRGGNYGWSTTEGREILDVNGNRGVSEILPPVVDHSHAEAMSITGGVVYHGSGIPALADCFVYGDYESGKIWAVGDPSQSTVGTSPPLELLDSPYRIVSFGTDPTGEVLVVDYNGGIYQLESSGSLASATASASDQSSLLSSTGLFTSTSRHVLATGVSDYSINAEMWHGGASASRFVAVPSGGTISYGKGKGRTTMGGYPTVTYPTGTVFGKTLSLPSKETGSGWQRVETQISWFDGVLWRYQTYQWLPDQSDARLVPEAGGKTSIETEKGVGSPWQFASRNECTQCHQGPPGARHTILGFIPEQLMDSSEDTVPRTPSGFGQPADAKTTSDRLVALENNGVIDSSFRISKTPPLVDPFSGNENLEARARSYLHVHCSHCHSKGGGAIVPIDLVYDTSIYDSKILGIPPLRGDFGITSPAIVAPGSPYNSVLLHRFAKSEAGKMPPIGNHRVDREGFRLIKEWIASLGSTSPNNETSASGSSSLSSALRAFEEKNDTSGLKQLLSSSEASLELVDDLLSRPSSSTSESVLASVQEATELASDHVKDLVADLAGQDNEEVERGSTRFGTDGSLANGQNGQLIMSLRGDQTRGADLLKSKGRVCLTCHEFGGDGTRFGPRLDRLQPPVGHPDPRAWVLESIENPSRWISAAFTVYGATTQTGETVTGILQSHDRQKVQLKLANQQLRELPTREIIRMGASDQSMMPSGLLTGWEPQEIADLLAALMPADSPSGIASIAMRENTVQSTKSPSSISKNAGDSRIFPDRSISDIFDRQRGAALEHTNVRGPNGMLWAGVGASLVVVALGLIYAHYRKTSKSSRRKSRRHRSSSSGHSRSSRDGSSGGKRRRRDTDGRSRSRDHRD